jgi:hypothetical protein
LSKPFSLEDIKVLLIIKERGVIYSGVILSRKAKVYNERVACKKSKLAIYS